MVKSSDSNLQMHPSTHHRSEKPVHSAGDDALPDAAGGGVPGVPAAGAISSGRRSATVVPKVGRHRCWRERPRPDSRTCRLRSRRLCRCNWRLRARHYYC